MKEIGNPNIRADILKCLSPEFIESADKALRDVNTCSARMLVAKLGIEKSLSNYMRAGLYFRQRGWTTSKEKSGNYRVWRRAER